MAMIPQGAVPVCNLKPRPKPHQPQEGYPSSNMVTRLPRLMPHEPKPPINPTSPASVLFAKALQVLFSHQNPPTLKPKAQSLKPKS